MKTQFPYPERIDLNAYLDVYFQQENAIQRLPTKEELLELARKSIVKGQPVSATVLEIKRKTVPAPTDEMVRALGAKDFMNQDITTVADYVAFIREQKVKEDLNTINYFILEKCQKDYPVTEYDEEDLQDMGRMAREFWRQRVLAHSGVDLETVTMEGFWIADFYTDHCAPCKALDMVISEIMFDTPEINLAKCDVEKSPAYMERFEIGGTPTMFFMLDGEIKETLLGGRPRAELEEVISKVMYGE